MLKCAYHLTGVLSPETAEERLRAAMHKLGVVDFDTLVVTGISGTVLGAILANRLGKKLAVVRRPGEAASTLSGSANDVEGWLGGRWVFFDDCIATGATKRRTKAAYQGACRAADVQQEFVGFYLHASGFFGSPSAPEEQLSDIPF